MYTRLLLVRKGPASFTEVAGIVIHMIKKHNHRSKSSDSVTGVDGSLLALGAAPYFRNPAVLRGHTRNTAFRGLGSGLTDRLTGVLTVGSVVAHDEYRPLRHHRRPCLAGPGTDERLDTAAR
jgi:hypothetical protein